MKDDLYSELFGRVALLDDANRNSPLGQTSPLSEEPLRFTAETSLGFPSSNKVKTPPGEQPTVSSAIFGLFGPIGALPFVYSEEVAQSNRSGSTAMADFFSLLNHRSMSLMYRAWRKHRLWLEHQTGIPEDQQDKTSKMLQGFSGVASLPPRVAWLEMERRHVLSSSDTMQRRVRNARGLAQLLRRHFALDFRVEEFVGTWETLPEEARSRFSGAGNGMRLGYNTVIGSRTWQVQSTFCVMIPYPSAEEYAKLQPGSEFLRRIQLMIRMYCTPELSFRIRIKVSGDVIEAGTLGGTGGGGAMLGWNTVAGPPDPDKEYSFSITKDYNESRMSA